MRHDSHYRSMSSIAFFGTPELSVWAFDEVVKTGITPTLVVTGPDKPKGRKLLLTPPPLKTWALAHDFPVAQPEKIDEAFKTQLSEKSWDLFIVVAYGLILPSWLLALPKHGTLNLHPSLLPKLRGPSPIRSAILLDQKEHVGASIIALDEKMDHGPIVMQTPIVPDIWPLHGNMLDQLLFQKGGELLAQTIEPWLMGDIVPVPQKHDEATFTKKFTKEDGLIDLAGDPYQNYLRFCAMEGWPGPYFFNEHGRRIKITDAAYEHHRFVIKKILPEGGRETLYAQ